LSKYHRWLERADTLVMLGTVRRATGLVIESDGPLVSLGELLEIKSNSDQQSTFMQVIGFHGKTVLSMPLGELKELKVGDKVVARIGAGRVKVGNGLLGRVINGLGKPIDGGGPIASEAEYPLYSAPVNPLNRERIAQILATGVRAVDGLLACGKGQRIGIFGGSGVGKSTLLGMMARYTSADVNVIALVGERGREVGEFIENDLGEEGLKRSVVIASTSDDTALVRIRAALTATAVAEFFKDQGKDVLLIMDSVTRFAMAQREIGLAAGEPPSSRGYTPSVFALLPRLLERAGNFQSAGSITGFYTVLVEGDDMNDPIADSVRSILDGHIVLSRELASRNHYPCIDILNSVSRLMNQIASGRQLAAAGKLREALANYTKAEDLINIGAYVRGSNPKIDEAIAKIDAINSFLRQHSHEGVSLDSAISELEAIFR